MLDKPLYDLFKPVVTTLGYELLGVERITQGTKGFTLRVYIDQPQGIAVSDCERVSYQISGVLEVEDPIQGTYNLEVSSPGLDRPLFLLAHYQQHVGKRARIRLRRAQQQRRSFTGTLQAVAETAQTIDLKVDDEVITFAYSDVERAHLIPDEDELRKSLNNDKKNR